MSAEVARGRVASLDERHGGTKALLLTRHGAYRARAALTASLVGHFLVRARQLTS